MHANIYSTQNIFCVQFLSCTKNKQFCDYYLISRNLRESFLVFARNSKDARKKILRPENFRLHLRFPSHVQMLKIRFSKAFLKFEILRGHVT